MNTAFQAIHWARIFSGVGIGLLIVLIVVTVFHFRQLRRDLAKLKSTGVIDVEKGEKILEAVQQIGVRQIEHNLKQSESIEGVRTHIASNHDEVDGELRLQNENTNWVKARLTRLYMLLTGDVAEPGESTRGDKKNGGD